MLFILCSKLKQGKAMKKMTLGMIGALGICLTGYADNHFVPMDQNYLIQNTSNDDFIVKYERCIWKLNSVPMCSNEKQILINAQSSNYSNPIKVSLIMHQQSAVHVLSVTNLKTNNTQDFPYNCAINGGAYNNSYSIITLSTLVDNPDIIICTPGQSKK